MGRRFALVIGAAALGAALLVAGASADFRSVGDPRGDTTCGHENGGHKPCSHSSRRTADIVGATAGHGKNGWLKHTIRVVGKFDTGALTINTDSDPLCEFVLGVFRGSSTSVRECAVDGPSAGRARYDFHRHSVEIFFSERSIGNPQSYGWGVSTWAGHRRVAHDFVPSRRHRLNDSDVAAAGVMALGAHPTAAVPALASQTVKIDSRVTLPPPQKNPFHGRVKSSKHACEVDRLVKVFKVKPGRDWFVDGDVKDRTNQRGKWRVTQQVLPEGAYYAKVRRKEVTAGTTFVCRQDRSPTTHVQYQG